MDTEFHPRTPAEGNLGKALSVVEIVLSILLFVCGIVWWVTLSLSDLFERVILGLFIMVFSLSMAANALGIRRINDFQKYYLFYQTWLGRGIFLIIMGCLVLIGKSNGYILACGILTLIYAFVAVAAHFIFHFGPPMGFAADPRPHRPLAEEPPQVAREV